jgi:hypothetical protein
MAINDTQLVIQAAPVDPAFEGNLQELVNHIVERLRIVAPFGISTFVIGTQIPTSDQGPLFLITSTGTSLWVWDDNAKTYVPLDISPSSQSIYAVSQTQPTDSSVLIWLQTDSDNLPQTLWVKTGGVWQAFVGARGTTAARPASPAEGQLYWDTDIAAQLIFERGQWRTQSGSPGDVKFVTHRTLSEALRYNPGWSEASVTGLGPSIRGRCLAAAHKDAGTSPVANNPAVSGVTTPRAAGDVFGEETHVLTNEETPGWPETHWHATGRFAADVNDDIYLITQDGWVADKDYLLRQCQGGGPQASATTQTITQDTVVNAIRGTLTTPPMQESDNYDLPTVSGHENNGPRYALWCLVKE